MNMYAELIEALKSAERVPAEGYDGVASKEDFDFTQRKVTRVLEKTERGDNEN